MKTEAKTITEEANKHMEPAQARNSSSAKALLANAGIATKINVLPTESLTIQEKNHATI